MAFVRAQMRYHAQPEIVLRQTTMNPGLVLISRMETLRIDTAWHRRTLRHRHANICHLMAQRLAGGHDMRAGRAEEPAGRPVVARYAGRMTGSHQWYRVGQRQIRQRHQPGIGRVMAVDDVNRVTVILHPATQHLQVFKVLTLQRHRDHRQTGIACQRVERRSFRTKESHLMATLNHPKRFVDNAQRLPAFAAVCFSVNNMHIFPVV